MAARGQIAKENVEKRIKDAFGNDYIGLYDKKIYVWANENGERIQIAIALTAPKTAISVAEASNASIPASAPNVADFAPIDFEYTADEKEHISAMMKRLRL